MKQRIERLFYALFSSERKMEVYDMRYVLTGEEMQYADKYTIEQMKGSVLCFNGKSSAESCGNIGERRDRLLKYAGRMRFGK